MRQLAVFLVLGLSVLMVAPPVQADRKRGTKGKPKYAQVWGAVEGTVRLSHPLEPRTVLYRCPKRDKPVLSRHAEHDPKTLSLSNCLVFVKEIKQGKAWAAADALQGPRAGDHAGRQRVPASRGLGVGRRRSSRSCPPPKSSPGRCRAGRRTSSPTDTTTP